MLPDTPREQTAREFIDDRLHFYHDVMKLLVVETTTLIAGFSAGSYPSTSERVRGLI